MCVKTLHLGTVSVCLALSSPLPRYCSCVDCLQCDLEHLIFYFFLSETGNWRSTELEIWSIPNRVRTGREREREARERERRGGEGEGGGGCPYLRHGCCHCGHLSEEAAATREKATDKSGRVANQEEAGRPRKSDGSGCGEDPETHLGLAGHPGGHQSGPQVRVQQHTAKERITECVDEEIVDAPVPYQSQQILGASSELLWTTIDDLVQEKAVKETAARMEAEEGGGGHGRSRCILGEPLSGSVV